MIGNLALAAPNRTEQEKKDHAMLRLYASTIFANAAYHAPTKNPNPNIERPKGQSLTSAQQDDTGTGYHKYLDPDTHEVKTVYSPGNAISQRDAPNMAALAARYSNRTSWPIQIDPYSFLDGYNDDDLWWALAWVTAYDVTNHTAYLKLAEGIFDAVSSRWWTRCRDGGLYWNVTGHDVNAITNELLFSTAAHLGNRISVAPKQELYNSWARDSLTWFERTGMINNFDTINDGLNTNCENNKGIVWSYNQGVIVGGLAEFVLRDESDFNDTYYITLTQHIQHATFGILADGHGIIHDVCEATDCGADGSHFKGILMRNWDKLRISKYPFFTSLTEYFRNNADSIWKNKSEDEKGRVTFGVNWGKPTNGTADASTHSSAMDCLVADLHGK